MSRDFDKRRAEIDKEEQALKWTPKKNHTDAEKIAAFDRMHEFAMKYVTAIKENERFKDADHYAYETLMENTVANQKDGKDFWDFRNNAPYDWEH